MNYRRLKIWSVVTLTLAIIAVVIRAIWQIVVIPTPGTMLVFIPFIVALLGANVLIIYLAINPYKLKSLPFLIGIIVALGAGLMAGVTHYIRFIDSPEADPFWSKVIGSLVILSSISGYLLVLNIIWSLRKKRSNG